MIGCEPGSGGTRPSGQSLQPGVQGADLIFIVSSGKGDPETRRSAGDAGKANGGCQKAGLEEIFGCPEGRFVFSDHDWQDGTL